jgi:hypothetical protein
MDMKARMKGGPRHTITSLNVMVKAVERDMWPTPKATDGDRGGRGDLFAMVRTGRTSRRREWPTPTTQDAKNDGGPSQFKRNTIPLNAAVKMWPTPTANRRSGLQSHGTNAILGQLNPRWLEWLMGYPDGWTELELSVTRSSRKSPNG